MSPVIQQRLIGSILLLCVLGGFAFFLINRASEDVEMVPDTNSDIPFVSSIDAITPADIEIVEAEHEALVDAQDSTSVIAEIKSQPVVEVEPVQNISEPKIIQKIDTTPTSPKKKITTIMWLLQLASLADRSAAEALSKKVKVLGYKAYIEKVQTPKGDRFRVRVGPEHDKTALEATSKVLENKLNLKPLILKQLPE